MLITDPVNFLHQRNDWFKLLVSVTDPVLELIMTRYQLLQQAHSTSLCRQHYYYYWSKSKVNNLYSGSQRNDLIVDHDRCRTASTILPFFIGLHAMAATNSALTWKPSHSTNLYCLVNRGTLVWTTCPRSLPDNAAAGSWTRDLPITSPTR